MDQVEQWVWVVLGIIFFYLAVMYWRYSNMPIRSFVSRRTKTDSEELEEVSQEITEFQGYLGGLNKIIQRRYRIASIGFLFAAFAMLFLRFR